MVAYSDSYGTKLLISEICIMSLVGESGLMMEIFKFIDLPAALTMSTFNITIVLATIVVAYFATYILKAQSRKPSKACKIEKPSKVFCCDNLDVM